MEYRVVYAIACMWSCHTVSRNCLVTYLFKRCIADCFSESGNMITSISQSVCPSVHLSIHPSVFTLFLELTDI